MKLIIDNRTDLSMRQAMEYAYRHINEGRISDNGQSYCFHIEWASGVHTSAFINEKSDRIVVHYNNGARP